MNNSLNQIGRENAPDDVIWAYAIRMAYRYISSSIADKLEEIYIKYPEWFPWESTYRQIPMDVHKAYFKERLGDLFELKPITGKGIWELMEERPKKRRKQKERSILDIVKESFKQQEKTRRERKKQYNRNKKLWDKYYKKFGLEYIGN